MTSAEPRAHRTAPQRLDQCLQRRLTAFRLGLDVAIAAVLHPAAEAERPGLAFDEAAEAHTLDVAVDHDPDPVHGGACVRTVAVQARVVPPLVPDPYFPSDGQIVHVHFRERGVGGDHRPPDRKNGQGQPP